MRHKGFWIGLSVLAIIAGVWGYARSQNKTGPADNFDTYGQVACINPELPVPDELHFHPHLVILLEGKQEIIPADIGIDEHCHRILHTHDKSGTIHIEPNVADTFYLGDFFSVWGKTFNQNQILDKKVDSNHRILMTVNGAVNREYENLVLAEGQEIRIEYQKVK